MIPMRHRSMELVRSSSHHPTQEESHLHSSRRENVLDYFKDDGAGYSAG